MEIVQSEYTFSKAEILMLRQLAKGTHALSEIKEALSMKPSLLSYNLEKLQKKGLIAVTKQGKRKNVYLSDSKHASLLRDILLTYDHIDWQNIITDGTIEILFQTLSNEDNMAKFPKTTLWRNLKNLKSRGIILPKEKGYAINPRFSILSDFLNEYQQFFTSKLVKELSESAVILWQADMEFLARTPKNTKPLSTDFHKTATTILYEFGIPLSSEYDIYFYSKTKGKIKPEDALLHTLLIEPNNVRYTTYALLLLEKTENKLDQAYLLQEAERLNLKNQISSMLQFLKTHTQQKDQVLPTWTEFSSKAKDYGIVIK